MCLDHQSAYWQMQKGAAPEVNQAMAHMMGPAVASLRKAYMMGWNTWPSLESTWRRLLFR